MKNLHLLQSAVDGKDTMLHHAWGPRSPRIPRDQQDERIFEFIVQFIAEHGYTPSSREIMLGVGASSTSVVWYAVQRLIAAGRLAKAPHAPRSLHLAKSPTPDGYIYKPLARSTILVNALKDIRDGAQKRTGYTYAAIAREALELYAKEGNDK